MRKSMAPLKKVPFLVIQLLESYVRARTSLIKREIKHARVRAPELHIKLLARPCDTPWVRWTMIYVGWFNHHTGGKGGRIHYLTSGA